MGKDILTPNKIQSYAERDYSTPKAHCDLDVMQKAEQVNTISKINPHADEDVLAMMDERTKMHEEGVLAKPKQRSHNQEWTDIERQLIKKAGDGYFDKRGHRRNVVSISNKDGEKEYIVNTSLLAKIVGMHPLVRGVQTLITICKFHKTIYQKISTSKTSTRKAITKKQLQQIAEVLSLEDWKILVDTKSYEMRETKRRETIRTKMEDYKDQIKQLEKEIKNA